MNLSFDRRRLLALWTSVVGSAVWPGALDESLAQDKPSLAVTLLDEHWHVLEPLAKGYADSVGMELDATPLGYDDLYSQLSIALTQRAATFDVVFMPDFWVPQFASFLTALDIDPGLARAVVPIAIELGRYPDDAAPCALPWLGEAQFFVSRPDWLARAGELPPETWKATVVAASTVAGELDSSGDLAAFGVRTLSGHETVESFIPILRGYGKGLIDPGSSVPQLDTAEALAAMETFLTLASFSPEESSADGALDNAQRFEAGQICMMSNFWSSNLLAARTPDEPPDTGPLASTLQPAQTGNDRQAMTGVWLAAIPVGSAFVDEARGFLNWLVSLEVQAALPANSLPPVRTEVFGDVALIDRFPDLPVLAEMLADATPRPRSPFYPQLEQLLATELAKALSGESSGADALKNANVAIREFLVREGVLDA